MVRLPPLKKQQPSFHLKWAKWVRGEQGEWLREHRMMTRPQPSNALTTNKPVKVPEARPKPDPLGRETPSMMRRGLAFQGCAWMAHLRSNHSAKSLAEQTSLKSKREIALRELHSKQLQWRKIQRQALLRPPEAAKKSDAESKSHTDSEDEWTEQGPIGAAPIRTRTKSLTNIRSSKSAVSLNLSDSESESNESELPTPVAATPTAQTSHRPLETERNLVETPGQTAEEEAAPVTPPQLKSTLLEPRPTMSIRAGATFKPESVISDSILMTTMRDSSRTDGDLSPSQVVQHCNDGPPNPWPRELVETLQEWREHFPVEVLNPLADFYARHDSGDRKVLLSDLEEVAAETLRLRPEILRGFAEEDGLINLGALSVFQRLSPSMAPKVHFENLSRFLDFMQRVCLWSDKNEPEVRWGQSDMARICAAHDGFSLAMGRMPVSKLFEALEALDIEGLFMQKVEVQQLLSVITQEVVRLRPSSEQTERKSGSHGSRWKKSDSTSAGTTLSLSEFVLIVTMAVRSVEQKMRLANFHRELQVSASLGMGPTEVEDLRELYERLQQIRRAAGKNIFHCLLQLLQECAGKPLKEPEVGELREIVLEVKRQGLQRGGSPSPTPTTPNSEELCFENFLAWMAGVLKAGLGGLHRHESQWGPGMISAGELQGKSGFTAMVMKELKLGIDEAERFSTSEFHDAGHSSLSGSPSGSASGSGPDHDEEENHRLRKLTTGHHEDVPTLRSKLGFQPDHHMRKGG